MTKVIDMYTSDPDLLHEALNEQDIEIEQLTEENARLRAALEKACEAKLREQDPVGEVVSNHRAGMYDEFPIGTLLYANPAPIPEDVAPKPEIESLCTSYDAACMLVVQIHEAIDACDAPFEFGTDLYEQMLAAARSRE